MMSSFEVAEKIYLDANLIIYLFERADELGENVARIFDIAVLNEIPIFMSEIGVAECLYGAFRLGSTELESEYTEFFYNASTMTLIPVDGSKLIAAARLGAEKRQRLIDAVHFHTAIECECDVFVTNDIRIRSSHGLTVLQLGNL
jgi:predicted nucleic acid-binding protein